MNKKIIVGVVAIVVIIVAVGFFVFNGFEEKTEEIEIASEEVVMEDAEKIRIMTIIEPPTNFLDEGGNLTGITVDFVRAIQKHLGNTDEIELMPWKRAYGLALEETNIILFTAGRYEERENLFNWMAQVTKRDYALFAKADSNIQINSLEDAKKVGAIGVMRGAIREQMLLEEGFTNLESVTEHTQNIEKLMLGRIDLMTSSSLEIANTAKEAGLSYADVKSVYVFKTIDSYIMMSKETPAETVEKWQKAAQELKDDGTYEQISEKWILYMRENFGIECDYKDGVFYFWRE